MSLSRIPQIWRNLAAHPLNGSFWTAGLRWTLWQARARVSKDVTLAWIDGLKLSGRHGMISISMQAYNGLHEWRDMCFAVHLLNKEDLFFDVGANIGVYSMLLSHVAGAKGVAFEPVPQAADYLARNIAQNHLTARVHIERAAVSAQSGTVSMSTDADVMNKIVAQGAGITVPAVTVDDMAAAHGVPQVIKIDVEGFEPDVIAGATHTLQDPKLLALILEINDNAQKSGTAGLLDQVQAAGFEETGYDPTTRALIAPTGDAALDNRLFIRTSARAAIAQRLEAGHKIHVRGKTF